MVLLPCLGGNFECNPARAIVGGNTLRSERKDSTEAGHHKFRGFHSQITFKGSELSGNGTRGYDCEALSAIPSIFHEMCVVAPLPLLIHEINLSYPYLYAFRKSGHGELQSKSMYVPRF